MLPKNVPLPPASAFCKRPATAGCKKCLRTWMNNVFDLNGYGPAAKSRVSKALVKELGCSITFGDPVEPTCKEIAAGWERAMSRLGYTEIYYE